MSVKKQRSKFHAWRSLFHSQKDAFAKKSRLRGRRSKQAGRILDALGLWQHVAEAHIAHGEMRVLGLISGHEPWRARQIRGLHHNQDRTILRVFPERLDPVNGPFLDSAVVGVG